MFLKPLLFVLAFYFTDESGIYIPSPQEYEILAKSEFRKYFGEPYLPELLSHEFGFDIYHVIINLWVDVPGDTIFAYVTTKWGPLTDSLYTYKVHLIGLTVDSVLIEGTPHSFSRQDSFLIVPLNFVPEIGDTYTTVVYYHGRPQIGGGVFGGGLEINPNIVYADNEPWGLKRWLPLIDLPNEKFKCDFHLWVPSNFKLIANGVLVDSQTYGNWKYYHYKENYPIAPYLVVFAASPNYRIWARNYQYGNYTMPILTAVFPQDSTLAEQKFARLSNMITYFSNTFGIYPFILEKYGHVHVPIGGAMENQTNTFINMRAGWGQDWDWVVAHELSHHWWGNWVTLMDWRNIWLNEGFASYCEALWYGERFGEQGYRTYMNQVIQQAIIYEPDPPFPIYDPPINEMFNWGVIYRKGACILHMLRFVMGDSLFFQALRTYGMRFAYSNASTEDFVSVCNEFYQNGLDWFFDQWVYRPGHPVYQWGWSQTDGYLYLMIRQIQNQANNVPIFKMPIEIRIQTVTGDTTVIVWDSLQYQEFLIPIGNHVLNVQFDPYPWIMKEAIQTTVAETKGTEDIYKLWINPFAPNGRLISNFNLTEEVKVTLYNIEGRKIKDIGSWDEPLKSGVYFIRVRKTDKIRWFKVISVK